MNRIYEWCVANRNGKVEPIGRISINHRILGKVTQYEYLGMILEHKLNMDKQIDAMYKKANKKLGILCKIRIFI